MRPHPVPEKVQEEFVRKNHACIEAVWVGAGEDWADGDAAVLALDLGDEVARGFGEQFLDAGFLEVAARSTNSVLVVRTRRTALAASFPRLPGLGDAPPPGWLPVVALTGGRAALAALSTSNSPGLSGMACILRCTA